MINYEPFLQQIAPAIQPKEKTTASLSEAEIRAAVANAYKEAVTRVADDTDGYTVSVPVHVYEGVKDYPIQVPQGFSIRAVNQVLENHLSWHKAAYIEDNTVRLPCCATDTVNNAYMLELAVVPDPVSSVCEFDSTFVNEYFHVILAYMRYTLSMQVARQWASLGHADRLHAMYKKLVKQRKNKAFNGLIRIKQERLTDASTKNYNTTSPLDTHNTGAQGCNSTCTR